MEAESLKRDLECMTGARGLAEGESMRDVLGRLDGWAAASDIPEALRHFLKRRSYVKALAWLADPETPHEP